MSEPEVAVAKIRRSGKSIFRFLWLPIPFGVLGAAAVCGGFLSIPVYDRYIFPAFLVYGFTLPLAIGRLGGLLAVRCLWGASFQGNNRKDVKTVFGLLLGAWTSLCLLTGCAFSFLVFRRLFDVFFKEDFISEFLRFLVFFLRANTMFSSLLFAEAAVLILVLILTLRTPYRFPV